MDKKAEPGSTRSQTDAITVLDSLVESVAVVDRGGTVRWTNQAWRDSEAMNDLAAEIGRRIGADRFEIVRAAPDDARLGLVTALVDGIEAVLAGRLPRFESEFTSRPLSDPHWILLTVTPLTNDDQVVVSCRDVTAQKLAEQHRAVLEVELNQAARRRSMGRLAGGVAHNLNNMLGVILGHTDLALNAATTADPVRTELVSIRDATERSARLIRQLLTFAGGQRIDPRPIDLGVTLQELVPTLQRLAGEEIVLSVQVSPDLWLIDADPLQVELIVTNLCSNARDAISGTGTIQVDAANVTIDADADSTSLGALPGDYVRLAVCDNGCGIAADVLADIFDPFFTTKEASPGKGLGLASVHGAVIQGGGGITASSDVGKGTTVEVYLPRHHPAADAPVETATVATPPSGPGGPRETILVVDDEPALLKATARVLGHEGYTVMTADNAATAIQIARRYPEPIDLLITDVRLPNMSGPELVDAMTTIRPALRCLLMSGYTSDLLTGIDGIDANASFIAKPFSIDDLTATVREILDTSH